MADETKNTGKIIAYILGTLAFIALIFGIVPGGWLRRMLPETTPSKGTTGTNPGRYADTDATPDTNYNGENKCVLRNSNGEEITISSTENNELFRRYCRGGSTEPVYLYNNYWYPYSYWYPRYWGRRWFVVRPRRGGHGVGGPGGPGSGTGGGTGPGTGGGTGGTM